jgi:hypothetical protein
VALAGFFSRQKSNSNKGSKVVADVAVTFFVIDECVKRAGIGIIADDVRQRLEKNTLAVLALAVIEKHHLCAGISRKGIPRGHRKEIHHFLVSAHHFKHELIPLGTSRSGVKRHRTDLGDVI